MQASKFQFKPITLILADVYTDPLKRREEFAVSLRKAKKNSIIAAKRMRRTQQHEQNLMSAQMLQNLIDSNRDKGNITYQDYYKFIEDEKWYEQLVDEIAPGFNNKVNFDTVSETIKISQNCAITKFEPNL